MCACRLHAFAALVVVAGLGCASATPPSPATPPSASPAVEPSTVRLDVLGLQMDVPGAVTVASGLHPSSVTVTSRTAGWRLTVEEGSSADTLDVARSAAERLDARNVKVQQTADGHWLTFERTGSAGETYGVHVVRRLGSQGYRCEGLVLRADDARSVLAACNTLRR
jgi:hypothetical protein